MAAAASVAAVLQPLQHASYSCLPPSFGTGRLRNARARGSKWHENFSWEKGRLIMLRRRFSSEPSYWARPSSKSEAEIVEEEEEEEDDDGGAGMTAPEQDDKAPDLGVRAALSMLKFYKREISPLLPSSCRYVPTCSEYSMEAYRRYGVVKGTVLTAWRLCRCNPLGGSGFDPPRWFDEKRPTDIE